MGSLLSLWERRQVPSGMHVALVLESEGRSEVRTDIHQGHNQEDSEIHVTVSH